MQNKRAIFLLFAANAISGISQGISMLAIPWHFALRKETAYFNTGFGLVTLLTLLWGIYAGALIDRFRRRQVFLLSNLLSGLLLGCIALQGYYAGELEAWAVMLVFAGTMLNYNIHYPTLYALSQEMSEADSYQRINANIEVVGQSTAILSGGLATLLLEGINGPLDFTLGGLHLLIPFSIERWPIHKIFALDAATYFIACLLILFMRYVPAKILELETGPVLSRIRSGFAFLKQEKEVLIFGLFSYSVFAALLVELYAVLPAYVEKHLEEKGSVFAIADLVYSVGAMLAGLFAVRVFSQARTTQAVIFLSLSTAAVFYWASFSQSVLVLYIVSLVLGFCNAGIRVLRLTFIFSRVPHELTGRVNSVFNMANIATRALFIFLFSAAFFSQGRQITWGYFILASFILLSALLLLLNKEKKPGKLPDNP